MEIILKNDVDGLGIVGDVIKVADGFARNYLLPKDLAEPASGVSVKRLEKARVAREFELQEELTKAQKQADRFKDTVLRVPVKVSDEGTLYGSVNVAEIVKAAEDEKIKLSKEQVLLDGPIKELGEHNVAIRLHPQVKTTFKVTVVAE